MKTKERVYILNGIAGIENMFTHTDLLLIDPSVKENADKVIEIGKNRKILFSKIFFEKVNNKEIRKVNLSRETIEKFEAVFNFINSYYS